VILDHQGHTWIGSDDDLRGLKVTLAHLGHTWMGSDDDLPGLKVILDHLGLTCISSGDDLTWAQSDSGSPGSYLDFIG